MKDLSERLQASPEQLERQEAAEALQALMWQHDILRISRHDDNYNIYRKNDDNRERFGCGKSVAEALENAQ